MPATAPRSPPSRWTCFASTSPTVFRATEPERETNAGDERTYLASVAPLASRSGGALFRYGGANAAGDDAAFAPPVPRDAFRALAGERRGAASAETRSTARLACA